jgi:hypothetical protein
MADKIKKSDLFEENLFGDASVGAEKLSHTIVELTKGITQLMIVTKNKINVINPETYKQITELNKQVQQSNVLITQKAKLDKEAIALQDKASKLRVQESKERQQLSKERQKEIKNQEASNKKAKESVVIAQKQANELKKLNSVYEQNKKQLTQVSNRYKELVSKGREGTATGKLLKAEFDRLYNSVIKAEESVKQFNRRVGDYRNAIKESINDTGLFNNGVGRLVVSLNDLKKKFEENAEGSGKFSDKLKLGVAGGIAIAVLALKELAEVNANLKQGFETLTATVGGFITGGIAGATAQRQFKEALFASYETLRLYGEELQKVTLDEDDFREISNDNTIGFKERNEALKESIRLSEERASKSLQIAELELDIIEKQVKAESIGLRSASPELLNKQSEARKKVNEALDVQSDLLRENAQLERQQAIARTSADIDLLLKNKQSANSRKANLEAQLEDERVQIEERKKLAVQLANENIRITNEEIKIFKNGLNVKFNANELVNEQDAIRLKFLIEQIKQTDENNKLVGLGEEATKKLAEIVAKYQKEKIDNDKQIKKLEEEELKRKQKLADIQKQIQIDTQTDTVLQASESLKAIQDGQEENFTKLLEDENVFIGKKNKQLKLQSQIETQLAEDLLEQEKILLKQRADLEKQQIDNTTNDKQIASAEKLRVENKYLIDLENLEAEAQAKKFTKEELELKREEEINKRKLEIAVEYGNKVLDLAEEGIQRQADKRNEAIEKEITTRQSAIERQKALAEKGLENTQAFEEKQLAEAELKREQEKKKELKRQKAIAFLRLVAGYSEKQPESAVAKAVIDIALADLIAGSFATGVENLQGEGTETSDSIFARLSKGESVITAKATKEHAGLPTALNEGRLDDYLASTYLPKVAMNTGLGNESTATNIGNSLMLHQLVGVNQRLQQLEKTIAGKREQNVSWDKQGNMVISEVEKGIKRTVQYMKRKPKI